MDTETRVEKKPWVKPELVEYGPVEELTRQTKLKTLGSGDDFNTNIVTVS
jgi:hypothetical protein